MRMTALEYAAYLHRQQNSEETQSTEGVDRESDLHDAIIADCRRRGWIVIHSRMDRATTTAKGVPDFLIFADRARVFLFEAKRQNGKLTPEQQGFAMAADMLGFTVHVVRSFSEYWKIVEGETKPQQLQVTSASESSGPDEGDDDPTNIAD